MTDIHDLLKEFGPSVIAILDSVGFFELEGQYDPLDVINSIPRTDLKKYQAASKEKNSKVWDIIKAGLVPSSLLSGAKQVAKQYQLPRPEPKTAQDWMDLYVKDHGGKFITNMSKTDQKKLVGFLWNNSNQNERPMKSMINIQPHLNYILDQGNHREETITRTENFRAVNYGGYKFAESNGAKTKTRWEVGDNRTRPSHRDMMGETVPIDEPYSNGEMYPGETDINCRGHNEYNFK